MKPHRRLFDANPDAYYEDDIRKLYENSVKDSFSNEFYATYIFADCIQLTLNESDCLGTPLSIGAQFLIKFEKCCAIGEISRIDDNSGGNKLVRILYLRLIKRETTYPKWEGQIQILKIRIELIHYDSGVYKKILSCFRHQHLKKAQAESRKQSGGFQAFRSLINGSKGINVASFIPEDSTEKLQNALRDAYLERQTFIFCTPSTDRLYEFARICNDDFEMSKQTILFPPGMFSNEKWKSDLLSKIKVHLSDYDLTDDWDITKIEHQINFRGQEAAEIIRDVHPRIIMGTPASLILVMQGLEAHYCTYRDRLPKHIIFDQSELIPDVFALILLATFPTIEKIEIYHQKEEVPIKYGTNTGSLATMAKQRWIIDG